MKLIPQQKSRKDFIVHVHFIHPISNRTDYYFGCLRAIFDRFSPDVVSTTIEKLWAANAGKGFKVTTRTCTIERVELLRCKQKRTNETRDSDRGV